jgi:predicted ArsR family transcriptional regulator
MGGHGRRRRLLRTGGRRRTERTSIVELVTVTETLLSTRPAQAPEATVSPPLRIVHTGPRLDLRAAEQAVGDLLRTLDKEREPKAPGSMSMDFVLQWAAVETEAQPPAGDGDDVARVCSLGDPARRGLYDYVVGQSQPVGRDESAAAVGISRSLAAYHLDRMVDDGLLDVSFARRTGRSGPGAGRPAKLYHRSPRQVQISLPPRDYELAAQLLANAVDAERTGRARASLEESARALGRDLAAEAKRRRLQTKAADPQAIVEEVLTDRGYEPIRDEEGGIRLRNCPFDRLADAHRELICGMNLCLLEEAVAGGTGLHAVLDPKPGMCCVAILPRPRKRTG